MPRESTEQFLARGGKIKHIPIIKKTLPGKQRRGQVLRKQLEQENKIARDLLVAKKGG